MASPGRSAYNASKMRVETVAADKTIGNVETGEFYLLGDVKGNTITLPEPRLGAYLSFKFIEELRITAATNKHFTLQTSTGSIHIKGACTMVSASHAHDTGAPYTQANKSAANDYKFVIGGNGNHDLAHGSTIDIVADGSHWYLDSHLVVTNLNLSGAFAQ